MSNVKEWREELYMYNMIIYISKSAKSIKCQYSRSLHQIQDKEKHIIQLSVGLLNYLRCLNRGLVYFILFTSTQWGGTVV